MDTHAEMENHRNWLKVFVVFARLVDYTIMDYLQNYAAVLPPAYFCEKFHRGSEVPNLGQAGFI